MQDAFEEVEGEFAFAKYMNTSELEEISAFLEESVKASCEGLMVKMLDGEESGYEPSRRSRNWLKVSTTTSPRKARGNDCVTNLMPYIFIGQERLPFRGGRFPGLGRAWSLLRERQANIGLRRIPLSML